MKTRFFSMALILTLSACGSAPPKSDVNAAIEYERFSAPLNDALTVNIGDHIFVEGEVAHLPVLSMSSGIQSTIPGAYGIPFSFSIDETDLLLRYRRGNEEFFCAQPSARHASFPGLGSVVASNDCIGVKRNVGSGEMHWVVDNSEHNRTTTVWSRSVRESDGVKFEENKRTIDDSRAKMEAIYFQGFHSDLLHFELRRVNDGEPQRQSFKFDYPPKTGDATYGIRGKLFKVISVDNTQMVYEWIAIP